MSKKVMRRMASDNEYLHKDFHSALNGGLIYLDEKLGEGSVKEYLEDFSKSFYAPLREDLIKRGLIAIEEHYKDIYFKEKSSVKTKLTDEELYIEIEKCPAVEHMNKNGVEPAKMYKETTDTVNKTICRDTQYEFELIEYKESTGKAKMRFYRRLS